jgi:outer membrane autotransporter protein
VRFAAAPVCGGRCLNPQVERTCCASATVSVRLQSGPFVTTTAASGHDFGLLGAGVTGRFGSGTSVSLNYDALIGSNDFVSHLITGRLRYVF